MAATLRKREEALKQEKEKQLATSADNQRLTKVVEDLTK